jgi:hypothetical protein
MKICFVFASRKGGVGKSFLAGSLLDFLRDLNGKKVIAIDADHRNHALAKRYGQRDENGKLLSPGKQDVWTGVPYLTASTAEQGKSIISALQYDADYVIVDLAGGADKDLRDLFPSEKTMKKIFERSGYRLVVVLPFDEQAESFPAAQEIVSIFGSDTQYAVVGNPKSDAARKDKAMDERFEELKRLLPESVSFALGATMHTEGATFYSSHDGAGLSTCIALAEEADPIGGMLTSGWIEEYRDRQGEIWKAVVEKIVANLSK